MHGLKGERVLMRILIEEQDRYEGVPLYEAIVKYLHSEGGAGATAFRGLMGFGATSRIHRDRVLGLRADDPMVIEVIDTEPRIKAFLPGLDAMIGGGLITLERIRVILYRAQPSVAERDEDARIDITGNWRTISPP